MRNKKKGRSGTNKEKIGIKEVEFSLVSEKNNRETGKRLGGKKSI